MSLYKDANGVLHDDMDGQCLASDGWLSDKTPATQVDIDALSISTPAQLAMTARADRNARLAAADVAYNIALDSGTATMPISIYRQALRDVPKQKGFPDKIKWPVL